jgi:hypothetical protein
MDIGLVRVKLNAAVLYAKDAYRKISVAERDELDLLSPKSSMYFLLGKGTPSVFEIERHEALDQAEGKEWSEMDFHNDKVFEAYGTIDDKANFVNQLNPEELELLKLTIAQKTLHNLTLAISLNYNRRPVPDIQKIKRDLEFCGLADHPLVLDGLEKAQCPPEDAPKPDNGVGRPYDLGDFYCDKMRESLLFIETHFNS